MAFFVLIALIAVAIIYISVAKKKKIAIAISLIVIGVYHLYVSHTCGPNSADVKVMKPMAEKISAYIIKNGIPKSLKDIPDLPYGLVGCERSQEYWDGNNNKINNINTAYSFQIDEKCIFFDNNNQIELSFGASRLMENLPNQWEGVVKMTSSKETVLKHYFKTDKNNKIIFDENLSIGSSKTSGICNPMRQ